ncbi:MAG: hypothetical protein ACO1SV_25465 [Fimbriimonas sp.]
MNSSPQRPPIWKGCALAAFMPCLICSGIFVWIATLPPPPPDLRSASEKLAEVASVLHLEFPASTELLYYRRDPDFERPFTLVLRMPAEAYGPFTQQKWVKGTQWRREYLESSIENFAETPFRPRNPSALVGGQVQTQPRPGEKTFVDDWAVDMLIEEPNEGRRTIYIRAFDPH